MKTVKFFLAIILTVVSLTFSTAKSGLDFPNNEVIVKVIDEKGMVILEAKVSVNQFLDKNSKIDVLPTGSLFVVLHGNTAYYITSRNLN